MTSSITSLPGATPTQRTAPRRGLSVLRGTEAMGLISLATSALSEALAVGHDIHETIYDNKSASVTAALQDQLAEVLTCLETAEHYALMLGDVLEDRPDETGATCGR